MLTIYYMNDILVEALNFCSKSQYFGFFFLVSPNQNARPCKKPCSLRTTCSNCTSNGMECMWCSSTKRCVDSNAYIISFPYGQCLEWQTATCSRKYLNEQYVVITYSDVIFFHSKVYLLE